MAGKGTPADTLAVELAAGRSVRDAATAAGVSERTAHRRLTDPAFRARVADLRADMTARAAGKLADAMTAAADELRRLLEDPLPTVRLRAAVELLDLGVKVRAAVELEARLTDLEGKVMAADSHRA